MGLLYQGFIQRESFWGGGGKLQEMGVALYTFLYNCPKFGGGGGGGGGGPPPDETLCMYAKSTGCLVW